MDNRAPKIFLISPDEPMVIPLGLMKYSISKFFTAFLLGKLSITIIGAFLGVWTKSALSEWLSPEATIMLSVIFNCSYRNLAKV